MRAALVRIDVVGETRHRLVVSGTVLQRHLDLDIVPRRFHVDGLAVQCVLVPVQVADIFDDAATVLIEVRFIFDTLILEDDFQAFVEEGEFAKPVLQRFLVVTDLLKNVRVRHERDAGTRRAAASAFLDSPLRHAALKRQEPHVAIALDLGLEPL